MGRTLEQGVRQLPVECWCHSILAPVAFVCNRRRKTTEERAGLVTIGGEQHERKFADVLGGDIMRHHAERCVLAVEGVIKSESEQSLLSSWNRHIEQG